MIRLNQTLPQQNGFPYPKRPALVRKPVLRNFISLSPSLSQIFGDDAIYKIVPVRIFLRSLARSKSSPDPLLWRISVARARGRDRDFDIANRDLV